MDTTYLTSTYESEIAALPAKERRLPKVFKAKWLKALRSGEYQQATGYLYKAGQTECGHCCLGVAGNMNGISNESLQTFDMPASIAESYTQARVPQLLLGDYDVSAVRNLPTLLSLMNDEGVSFARIASVIERYC